MSRGKEAIQQILAFYQKLGRPLTAIEIGRATNNTPFDEVLRELDILVNNGAIYEKDGFYSLTKELGKFSPRLNQDFLLDLKWKKLSHYARLFRHVPFIEFALASGSMALGNVAPLSDFDVLVGVRDGRMFISRYCLLALFSLFRMRRPDDKKASPNRFCFNHFVTENAFAKPPYNTYRQELYRNLVPIWGKQETLKRFFKATASWSGSVTNVPNTERYVGGKPSLFRRTLEWTLSGIIGDQLEKFVAGIAKRRLERYVKNHPVNGRAVVSDAELEFHFSLPYEK